MPDPYLDTVSRMEPDIACIDAAAGAASMAISLKRIADALEVQTLLEIKSRVGNIPGLRRADETIALFWKRAVGE